MHVVSENWKFRISWSLQSIVIPAGCEVLVKVQTLLSSAGRVVENFFQAVEHFSMRYCGSLSSWIAIFPMLELSLDGENMTDTLLLLPIELSVFILRGEFSKS